MENKSKKHILICGDRGVGKSTLVEKLLSSCPLPRYGFITKKMAPDEKGFYPVYIHPASQLPEERTCTPENLIGSCDGRIHRPAEDVFNDLGARYIREAKPDGIIVMDELGFLESQAAVFTEAVLEALEGDIPVIAVVKNRMDVPFLQKVCTMPKAELFFITKENRDQLYEQIRSK